MKLNKLFAATMIASSMLSSCSNFNPENLSKEWDVVTIGTENVVPGPNAPFIGFENEEIYGYTGCNRINGGIKLSGSSIEAKNIATTMKLCPDAVYEQGFLSALNEAAEIKESKKGFDLLDKKGNKVLTFAPRSLDVKLLEGQWNLSEMNGESITKEEDVPFLIFDLKENRLAGFTGCNRLTGTLDTKKLKECVADFTNMGMTRMMCQDNHTEADFVDALNHAKTLRVVDNTLYIYNIEDGQSLVLKKK